jgi:hypothetical protein
VLFTLFDGFITGGVLNIRHVGGVEFAATPVMGERDSQWVF